MRQILTKLIAVMLVVFLLFSVSGATISYAVDELMSESELENQNEGVEDKYVAFDAYFEDSKHSITSNAYEGETKLNIEIEVKEAGYLENATVDFSDSNFIIESVDKPELVSEIKDKQLVLNKISGGDKITLIANLKPDIKDQIKENFFNKDNSLALTGNFVNEKQKTTNITKNIVVHISWTAENPNIVLDQGIEKYIFIKSEANKGMLIQESIKAYVENSILPIKTSHVEINVPRIENELPTKVSVVSNKDGFEKENWNYDNQTGLLTIDTANQKDDQENISWTKGTIDEYRVIFIYSATVMEKVQNSQVNYILQTKVGYDLYNNIETKIDKTEQKEVQLSEEMGSLIDIESQIVEDSLNKGYMYTNTIAAEEDRKETLYTQRYNVNVSDAELVSEITIDQLDDSFVLTDGRETEARTTTKGIRVNKEQLQNLLGEEGSIQVISDDEIIAVLNKDSETDGNGNIIVELKANNNIKMLVSKPAKVGNLVIDARRSVLNGANYDKATLELFSSIKTNTGVTLSNGLPVNIVEDSANLEEPTVKAEVIVDKDTFSTVSKNNSIEIKTVLETDSADDDLYVDPIIDIALPSYIQDLNITNAGVLYTDELVKTEDPVVYDYEGGKAIRMFLVGTQTKYNSNIEKGITVVINADIEINKLTPSKTETINVTFKNNADGNVYQISKDINFVAPTGMVTINELENYAPEKDAITLVSGESNSNEAFVEAYSDAILSNYKGQIINNNRNDISEVKILGNIPNSAKEGNSFDTVLYGDVKVNGEAAKVFYSENANATSDIENAQNGWALQVEDYSKVKSYLIIVDENMAQGSTVEFEMPIAIPSNLSYKNTDEINYEVSYKNNTSVGVMDETATGNSIVLKTGEGPILEVNLDVSKDLNNKVRQYQHVDFTATIKNTGSDASNVILTIDETYGRVQELEGSEYSDAESEIIIGDIKAGETKTVNYVLTINGDTGNANFKASVTADKINNAIEFNKDLEILNSNLELTNTDAEYLAGLIKGGSSLEFDTVVTNRSESDLHNVRLAFRVHSGAVIKQAGTRTYVLDTEINEEPATINKAGNIANYVIDEIPAGESIVITINTTVDQMADKVETQAYAELSGSKDIVYSNIIDVEVAKSDLSINTQTNNNDRDVFEGQTIEYKYVFANTGNTDLENIIFKGVIPEGATIEKARVEIINNENSEPIEVAEAVNGEFSLSYPIMAQGEQGLLNVTLATNVFSDKELEEKELEKELKMNVKVSSDTTAEKESDPIVYYVIYNEGVHRSLTVNSDLNGLDDEEPGNNENGNNNESNGEGNNNNGSETPSGKQTYKISGKVWLDENKNAKQDEKEKGIENIPVRLIDLSTMEFVKENNADLVIKTSKDGTYTFTNLKNGSYMVAFDYSNTEYNISQYHKEGVSNSINSDAIERVVNVDGNEKVLGITDKLDIENGNIRNVDLGLSISSKFDLELTKRVNKITINNDKGIEDHDYTSDPKKLGKVEIKDKYVESSNVIIEYKITVKNTGDVIAYVTSVVDYIPEDLKFTSELNKDWYLGTDGNAYNTSIAKTGIEPGASKELTIILSKKMTEENTGLVNNDAEIFDAYNVEGIKNINAEAGNKNKSESDMDTASVTVSVKTGETVFKYTALIVAVIAILTFGIYMVKIKVLDRKI